jgi:hypothetical protein
MLLCGDTAHEPAPSCLTRPAGPLAYSARAGDDRRVSGKQIKLFLVDGTPGGLTTAEITNWTGHVFSARRSDLADLLKREEVQRAGLQVGDRVMVPGPGLRLSRAVLASNGGGELYVDTLKNKRARTVPLVPAVVPIVDRWSAAGAGVNGSSPRRRAVRCAKRTGSGRSAGVTRRRQLGGPSCASTTCATRRLRCGWRLALIRKWSSEYWDTPQLP